VKAPARFLAGAFACLLLLGACSAADPAPEKRRQLSPEAYAAALAEATNETRAELGLPPLRRSRCLEAEAKARAEALMGKPLEHQPLHDTAARCAPGGRVAENLVKTSRTPQEVLDSWMDSSGHRNNLVDPALDRVGIACVDRGEVLFCSQLFLEP
jgi:uncharacterized protein YkwD